MSLRQSDALSVEMPAVLSQGFGRALWRYRWIVILSLLLGSGAGVWLVSRSSPVSAVSSRLLFQQHFGTQQVRAPAPYLHAQAELIASPEILNDASVALMKQHLKSFDSSSDLFGTLKRSLKMNPDHDDGTLTVSFSGPASSDNSIIVNTVVSTYRHYLAAHSNGDSAQTLLALDRQRAGADSRLATDLRQLNDFRSHSGIPDTGPSDPSADLQEKNLARLNDEMLQAQSNVLALEAKYDSLAAKYGVPGNATANSPATEPQVAGAAPGAAPASTDGADPAWIQNRMSLASARLELLKSRGLPDSNPGVQDARAAVDLLGRQLAAARRSAGLAEVTRAASDLDIAKRHAAGLQASYETHNKAQVELDARQAEMLDLADSVERARNEANELDSQIKQTRENQVAPMEVTLLSEAHPVESPITSDSRTIGIAAAVGLLLGFCLSVSLYATDQRLRSPGDISRLLRLPVIGVIPRLPGKPSVADSALSTHANPMSAIAEAARTVRSAIFFAGKSTSARTIVITSAGKDQGASTFASNLAIAMAQAGSLTLLLDANFRDPKIREIFQIVPQTGLSDVLSGKQPLDRAIARTSIERVEVLACGSSPRAPAELLNSGAFSRLIEQLHLRYQCIILDSPAVSKEADARILAATADLTLFVVRAGSTRRKSADHALEQLLSVGARILGAVLNDAILQKPMQRSRGILRFVETPPADPGRRSASPPQGSSSVQSAANSTSTASGMEKQRMESNITPEVEIVE